VARDRLEIIQGRKTPPEREKSGSGWMKTTRGKAIGKRKRGHANRRKKIALVTGICDECFVQGGLSRKEERKIGP